MMKKFTDNLLGQLYLELIKDYSALRAQHASAEEIYAHYLNRIGQAFDDEKSSLYGLDDAEQHKVFETIKNFLLTTEECKKYTDTTTNQARVNFISLQNYKDIPVEKRKIQYPTKLANSNNEIFCASDGYFLTTLLLLNRNMPRTGSIPNDVDSDYEGLILFIFFIVVAFLICFTCLAFFYLLNQTLNSVERFYYGEGWLQGMVTLATIAASATLTATLTSIYALAPLISLILAAGLTSPMGMAVFTIVSLTLISAAISCFLVNQVQNWLIKTSNSDALDSKDPHRFTLTKREEKQLIEKDIDVLKVRLAITILCVELGAKPVSPLLNRLFTREGARQQEILTMIRQLKSGNIPGKSLIVQVRDLVEGKEKAFNFNLALIKEAKLTSRASDGKLTILATTDKYSL